MWLHWLLCVGRPGSKGPAEDFLTPVAIAALEYRFVAPTEVLKITLEFIWALFLKSGALASALHSI